MSVSCGRYCAVAHRKAESPTPITKHLYLSHVPAYIEEIIRIAVPIVRDVESQGLPYRFESKLDAFQLIHSEGRKGAE